MMMPLKSVEELFSKSKNPYSLRVNVLISRQKLEWLQYCMSKHEFNNRSAFFEKLIGDEYSRLSQAELKQVVEVKEKVEPSL